MLNTYISLSFFDGPSTPITTMLYIARVVVFSEISLGIMTWSNCSILCLAFVIIFAIIVLGLAADFTHTTRNVLGTTFNFAALAISTAAITIVTLPVL